MDAGAEQLPLQHNCKLSCSGHVKDVLVAQMLPAILLVLAVTVNDTLYPAIVVACAVPARRLAASGPVVCMSVLSMPPHHYLLVVHEGSGAAVWDFRAQVVVAVLSHISSSAADGESNVVSANGGSSQHKRMAAITAAAWLPGSSKGDFATGHQDGSVCVWDMPPSAGNTTGSTSNGSSKAGKLPRDLLQQQQTLQAQLVLQLQGSSISASYGGSGDGSPTKKHGHRSSRAGPRYRPVASLDFVGGAVECLAVFGGNDVDRPDGLTLLPLPEPTQVRKLFVCGTCCRRRMLCRLSCSCGD